MKLKGFKQYISEKQTDPELVLKMQEEQGDETDKCNRCGKTGSDCICQNRDYGSTVNLYRLGKGKLTKPKNNFKVDESQLHEYEYELLNKNDKKVKIKAKDADQAGEFVSKKYPKSDPMLISVDGKVIDWKKP